MPRHRKTSPDDRAIARRVRDAQWAFMEQIARCGDRLVLLVEQTPAPRAARRAALLPAERAGVCGLDGGAPRLVCRRRVG